VPIRNGCYAAEISRSNSAAPVLVAHEHPVASFDIEHEIPPLASGTKLGQGPRGFAPQQTCTGPVQDATEKTRKKLHCRHPAAQARAVTSCRATPGEKVSDGPNSRYASIASPRRRRSGETRFTSYGRNSRTGISRHLDPEEGRVGTGLRTGPEDSWRIGNSAVNLLSPGVVGMEHDVSARGAWRPVPAGNDFLGGILQG